MKSRALSLSLAAHACAVVASIVHLDSRATMPAAPAGVAIPVVLCARQRDDTPAPTWPTERRSGQEFVPPGQAPAFDLDRNPEAWLPDPPLRRTTPRVSPCLDRPLRGGGRAVSTPAAETEAAAPLGDNAPPPYPSIARRFGYEGTVTLEVRVSPIGTALSAVVKSSSGHGCLDEAALDAVRRWSFSPASRNGRPVEDLVEIPIRFRLTD